MADKKMKTNVILVRNMGKYEVKQRSKDGMFNATALLKQWNDEKGMKKEVTDFFKLKQTKEYLKALEQDSDFLNTGNHPYLKSRGKNGGTWMHPYLFIDFAMWLNPKFKLQVIKFVYDELIKNRHITGIGYKYLSSAVRRLKGDIDYSKMAKGLNYIVFGYHESGIRNKATETQLKELGETQQNLATMVELDFITTFDELMAAMRKIYRKKYLDG